jgi:dTDP-4-dehydrorhamnose 3,5-epimerase
VRFIPTDLPGVILIEPQLYADQRGFFMETWQKRRFEDAGLTVDFVQDNHSMSVAGVLRGLHYQVNRPQGKLVRVVVGRAYDVAVDMRRSSAHFGKWTGVELSAENRHMLWVPPGFAHGFYTLSERMELMYKCTEYYAPLDERTIVWDDPDLSIAWPLEGEGEPTLSDKDRTGAAFREAEVYP